jgi:hypothetical protein
VTTFLVVAGVIAFFAVGAAYLVASARILAGSGKLDEPVPDDADTTTFDRAA